MVRTLDIRKPPHLDITVSSSPKLTTVQPLATPQPLALLLECSYLHYPDYSLLRFAEEERYTEDDVLGLQTTTIMLENTFAAVAEFRIRDHAEDIHGLWRHNRCGYTL